MPFLIALAALVGLVLRVKWTTRGREWYHGLEQPAWGVSTAAYLWASTVLAVVGSVAAILVWQGPGLGIALWLWFTHLLLDVLWPWLFFTKQRLSAAFTWICLVWTALGLTTAAFWAFVPAAGLLLLPQLVWTTYLGAAVFFTWQLNPPSRH